MGTRTAGFDVPLFIQFKEIFENIGVWRMPDGKKQPVDGNIQLLLVGLPHSFDQMSPLDPFFTKQTDYIMFEKNFNLRMIHHPLLHNS